MVDTSIVNAFRILYDAHQQAGFRGKELLKRIVRRLLERHVPYVVLFGLFDNVIVGLQEINLGEEKFADGHSDNPQYQYLIHTK